jgi:hypothetical protein
MIDSCLVSSERRGFFVFKVLNDYLLRIKNNWSASMKPTKSSHRSFKNLVIKSSVNRRLTPNQNHGETVIPIGSNDLFVELPRLSNTYTYNVINTDEMTGDIQLRTSRGASLRGLILNTVGGLSIDKIETGTESITMESNNKDGSFISLLSNGEYWYMWSIVSGGSLSVQYLGDDSVGESPTETTEYAGVTATLIISTVSFPPPSLVARHTLNYGGSAEPGSNITVTTVATQGGTPVGTFTVPVDEQGRWTASFVNISNGQYTFSFTDNAAPEGVVNSVSDVQATNSGPLTFTTPSSFDLDPNENFDFATGLEVLDPNGNDISNAVTIDSSDFSGKVHGETFSIIYTFTYDGTEYSKTIEGLVADDTPPSKPVISSAIFDETVLDRLTVTGTTDVGTTLKLYKGSVYLGDAAVDGSGNWTFTTQIGFNVSFNLTAQANDSATPISGDSRSFPNYSALSDPLPITLNTPTLTTPTLTVNNENSAVFTNASNSFVLEGTTDTGSIITLFNGSTQITPISGPTYNGTMWSASIDVSDESVNTLTAVATKAGFNQSTSSPFQLSVDRNAPTNIILAGSDPQIVYLGDIGVNNDPGISSVDDFSTTTTVSNWSTQVDATEGDKNVTYTITDAAGNSSTISRVVSVTTAVIIPTNLVVVDNEDGTFTVTGDVDGDYADNLTVQIIIDGTLDGTTQVIGGEFSYSSTTLPEGEYTIGVNTTNSAGETPSESEETTETVTVLNIPPTIAVYREISADGLEDDGTLVTFGDATVSNGELVLDGAGDYAELAHNNVWDLGGLDTTIDFWFYANELPDGDEGAGGQRFGLLSKASNNVVNGWTIVLDNDPINTPGLTDGQMQVTLNNGGNNQHVRSQPSNGISINEWHHFAVVLPAAGNGDAIMYFDGEELSSFTINQRPNGNTEPLRFGAYKVQNSIQQFFPGKLDGVTITKSILTPAQILEKYQTGRSVEITNGDTISITNGTGFNYYSIATDTEDGSLVASPTETPSLDTSTNGTYSIQHSVTDSGGLTTTHSFDVNVLANYLERSATLYGDAAIANCTLNLDGTGDFGTVPDGFRYTDLLSVSVWFKTSASGDRRIVSSHIRSGSPVENGWLIYLDNGQLKFFEPSFTNGTNVYTGGTGGKNDDQWHHVVLTWDKTSTWHFYIDGVQVRQGNSNPNHVVSYISGWDLYIGANGYNNNNPYGFFNGEITKVEVLNEVLSPTDVADRYNVGPETC